MSTPLFVPLYGSEEFGSAAPRDENEGAGHVLLELARHAAVLATAATLSSALAAQPVPYNAGDEWPIPAAGGGGTSQRPVALNIRYSSEEIAVTVPLEDGTPPQIVVHVEGPKQFIDWRNEETVSAVSPGFEGEPTPPLPFVWDLGKQWKEWHNEEIAQQPIIEDDPQFQNRVVVPSPVVFPPLPHEDELATAEPAAVGGGGGVSRPPVRLNIRYGNEEIGAVPTLVDELGAPSFVVGPAVVTPLFALDNEELPIEAAAGTRDEELRTYSLRPTPWKLAPAQIWLNEEQSQQAQPSPDEQHWRHQVVAPARNDAVLFWGDEAYGSTPVVVPLHEDVYQPVIAPPLPAKSFVHRDWEYVPPIPIFEDDQVHRLHNVAPPIILPRTADEEWVPDFVPRTTDEPGPVLHVVPPRIVLPPPPFEEDTVPFVPVLEEDRRWPLDITHPAPVRPVLFTFEDVTTTPTVSEEDQPPVLFSIKAPVVLPRVVDEEKVTFVAVLEEDVWTPGLVIPAPTVLPTFDPEEISSEGSTVIWEDLWEPAWVVLRAPTLPVYVDADAPDQSGLPHPHPRFLSDEDVMFGFVSDGNLTFGFVSEETVP